LVDDLEIAITDLAEMLGSLEEVAPRREAAPDRSVTGDWLSVDGMRKAASLIGQAGTQLAPSFISDRYELRVDVKPLSEWSQRRLDVRLLPDAAGPQDSSFPLEAAAAGLRPWVELALREAAALARAEYEWILGQALLVEYSIDDSGVERMTDSELAALGEIPEGVTPEEYAASVLDDFYSAGPERLLARQSTGPDLAGLSETNLDTRNRYLEHNRGVIYIVDEPERHLHPGLQRPMARWMGELARRPGAQVLLATHSIPFVALRGEVAYSYGIRPPGAMAEFMTLSAGLLDKLDLMAEEMGFDRGELLTVAQVLLWVEGMMDKVVLESLFATELRQERILVVPMHGVGRAKGMLDAEVMLRLTAAPAAAWFDNVPTEFVDRLHREADFALAAAKDRSDPSERRDMARLVRSATKQGRRVEPIPHPGKDVFDLLDERTIIELFPDFPGHSAARKAWSDSGGRGGGWKDFYRARFSTPVTEDSCRTIAESMRARNRIPESLTGVLEHCQRLAMEAES
jgi:hypothetical protein